MRLRPNAETEVSSLKIVRLAETDVSLSFRALIDFRSVWERWHALAVNMSVSREENG
jgi:hypothetical protein